MSTIIREGDQNILTNRHHPDGANKCLDQSAAKKYGARSIANECGDQSVANKCGDHSVANERSDPNSRTCRPNNRSNKGHVRGEKKGVVDRSLMW
jgi:hypothetical protein